MAKVSSRPNSTYSDSGETSGLPTKFGSGRWKNSNQISGLRFKVCLCGKNNVGKTSIFLRLQGQSFSKSKPTSAISTYEYTDKTDPSIEYSIWNPAYEEVDTLTFGNHYRNAHCIILVYDVTDFSSLEYCNYEIEKIEKKQYSPHAKYVLVQNKIDKKQSKHIPYATQKQYILNSQLRLKVDLLVQMSAKTNEGIEEFFHNELPLLLQLPKDNQHTAFDSFLESSTETVDGKKVKKKKINCATS